MPKTLFIDTNALDRHATPNGDFTEILNNELAGAQNVVGTLRWLSSGQEFEARASDDHQLIYLMDGAGSITLAGRSHDASRGMGVYLGPGEGASIRAADGESLKLFQLVVRQIPK